MSMPNEPLEIICDAPPYAIVQASKEMGIEAPEDFPWCTVRNFFARSGLPLRQELSPAELADLFQTTRLPCTCRGPLPNLIGYQFVFRNGATARYSIGQCPRCKTVYWT